MDLSERSEEGGRRHPWERVRFDFFSDLVRHQAGAPRAVLDVGAGDAWFASRLLETLPAESRITCWDSGYSDQVGSELAPPPGIELVAERPTGRFDLVLLLDVLEHVPDDGAFLAEICRESAAPGTRVLISVPAWPSLYTSHDERLRHFRRYRAAEGLALARSAGLEVELAGGLFPSLLPLRAAGAVRERLLGPAAATNGLEWSHGPLFSWAVESALGLDARLSRWLAGHGAGVTGLSWWALCHKP